MGTPAYLFNWVGAIKKNIDRSHIQPGGGSRPRGTARHHGRSFLYSWWGDCPTNFQVCPTNFVLWPTNLCQI